MKSRSMMAALIGVADGMGMLHGNPPRRKGARRVDHLDFDRMVKAEEKRARKAAKLSKVGL